MYRILVHAPKMPKGPIRCPKSYGITYKLTFSSKSKSTDIMVNPTGCEGVKIGNKNKTLAGDKKSDEFWYLLVNDLKIDVKELKYGNEQ